MGLLFRISRVLYGRGFDWSRGQKHVARSCESDVSANDDRDYCCHESNKTYSDRLSHICPPLLDH